jgi:hypothetical protein
MHFKRLLALWAENALGVHAGQGTVGFFGLAKETTWGTAVAVTDYLELLSEKIATEIDRFPTRNVYGGFYEADDYAGLRRSAGSIVHAAHPVSLGHLLKGVFNTHSVSVVASGFLFRNTFTSTRSEYAAGVPRQPYTLEANRDVGSSHRFSGALINKLTLALAPNQDLRVTAEFIAKNQTIIAATTPTFPGSSQHPFTFDTASVSIAGSATTRFEAFTMVIDNSLEGIPAFNNSNEIAKIRSQGPQMIKISGTLDFADVTEHLDFLNQTERTLALNLTRADSFNCLIECPRFVYTAYPIGIPGRGRITVAFDGMARYQTTSLTAVLIQLTTTKSNY